MVFFIWQFFKFEISFIKLKGRLIFYSWQFLLKNVWASFVDQFQLNFAWDIYRFSMRNVACDAKKIRQFSFFYFWGQMGVVAHGCLSD